MRTAEPGDYHLHLLAQKERADETEYRALCAALFRSAVADLCCVPLTEMHSTYGRSAMRVVREPRTKQQVVEREMALAWVRGDAGTASEPLRFVDVCEALDLDTETTRRRLLSLRPVAVRERTSEVAWQMQAVPA